MTLFSGSTTAMITPFKGDGVDYDAFAKFIDWQIEQGTNGLVPCGTTGESATLTHDEHNEVIAFAIKQAAGRVGVMAGTGSNSTREAISMSVTAEKAGADALLIVAPYYNKPTQEGLYQHYKAINDAVGIPVIVYNIPGRSVVNIGDETLKRLIELKNIKGIKDATGDLSRIDAIKPYLPEGFIYLGGDDGYALDFNARGAVGTISVTSNIAPKLVAQMQALSLAGDVAGAQAIQDKLLPLHDAMFCETSPGPVKFAAKLLGLCDGTMRLPMVEIAAESKVKVEAALKELGLV
jgi:4-hydroxy-tetrahydrodipicolinate synthase